MKKQLQRLSMRNLRLFGLALYMDFNLKEETLELSYLDTKYQDFQEAKEVINSAKNLGISLEKRQSINS